MIGALIGRKYRVVGKIGAGGMGTVYEAQHVQTGRAVAVKVLRLDRLPGGSGSDERIPDPSAPDTARAYAEEMAERFKREALATGRIVSDHVVEVLDADTDPDTSSPFIVMELLQGETVHELVKRVRVLTPRAALAIAAQACDGLRAAHEAGIVHRDVKTANLLLADRPDGTRIVKVLDFGIAKVEMDRFSEEAATGLTLTGSVLGSPQFMAPEQARGLKTIDHRADLWSLGVVLYRMLTGALPFGGSALAQMLLEICGEEPEPVRARAPWVPSSIADLVTRCLRKDPRERWSTAAELGVALRRELDALHARAGAIGPSEGTLVRDTMLVAPTEAERIAIDEPPLAHPLGESVAGASAPSRARPGRKGAPTAWFVGAGVVGAGLAVALVVANTRHEGTASAAATTTATESSSPPSTAASAAERPTSAAAPELAPSAIVASSASAVPAADASSAPPSPSVPKFALRDPPSSRPIAASSAAPVASTPIAKPSGHVGGTTTFE